MSKAETKPDEEQPNEQPDTDEEQTEEEESVKEPDETEESEETQGALVEHDYPDDYDGFTFSVLPEPFKDFWGYIEALVDECKVNLDQEGIHVTAVDPANVGMIDTTYRPSGSTNGSVNHEIQIGLNVTRLTDIIKHAQEEITLSHNPDTRNLIVEYEGHEFTLGLIDPDSIRSEPDLPDLDLPAVVQIDAEYVQTAIKHSDQVSNHVRIRTHRNENRSLELEFSAEGDTDEYMGRFVDREIADYQTSPDECHSLYSLDYLKDMVKAYDKDTTLEIMHGEEFPLKMSGPITYTDEVYEDGERTTVEREVGEALYMLAPRIQSE